MENISCIESLNELKVSVSSRLSEQYRSLNNLKEKGYIKETETNRFLISPQLTQTQLYIKDFKQLKQKKSIFEKLLECNSLSLTLVKILDTANTSIRTSHIDGSKCDVPKIVNYLKVIILNYHFFVISILYFIYILDEALFLLDEQSIITCLLNFHTFMKQAFPVFLHSIGWPINAERYIYIYIYYIYIYIFLLY